MPSMSQAHFELIAETIQDLGRTGEFSPYQLEVISETFADALKRTNGEFRKGRFLAACVPGANVRARS